ncbi:Ergosterol biosynthetic protein 28 [Melia azedarach]|uniref:Ergosterol biosynthetic protein 28 n=1 Tax=Melia azedarach TaxID=155640 RepID=A0ACC1Y0M8_MELAZ|nr:Ergosterol biosynthetic protein 28 [Melia azedarach]
MRLISWWLLLAGLFQLASILFTDLIDIWNSLHNPCSRIPVTNFNGRHLVTWGIISSTACIFCALKLENKPLYMITILSFVFALNPTVHEYIIDGTMNIRNFPIFFFFAALGISRRWILLQ